MPLMEIANLSAGYALAGGWLRAVDDVSLTVDRGETFGIVGESGCGKSTLGFSILKVLSPNGAVTNGRILLDGVDLLALSPERLRRIRWKRVSMIFQGAMNYLNPVVRVGDLLVEVYLAHEKANPAQARSRIEELFDLVGLDPSRTRSYPHELSGGMRQRVVIAMSLLCNPDLVVADEPTTAFDVVIQDQILDEIAELQRRLNLAMLIISHDISIIAETCDRVAVMYAGQIVEQGRAEDLFRSPRHPYTIALLHSYPRLEGPRTSLVSLPGDPPDLIHPPEGCRFAPRCPRADARCATEPPVLISVDAPHGHASRCHYVLDVSLPQLSFGGEA